jgi:hypothetical protein
LILTSHPLLWQHDPVYGILLNVVLLPQTAAMFLLVFVHGFAYVDRISWHNYNEAGDLKEQIELYHSRFGFYPQSVHADNIYRNRENRKFCKKHGIRLLGPALGRPPKQIDIQQEI